MRVSARATSVTLSASVAQLAEHALRKRMVMGSIPIGGSLPKRSHRAQISRALEFALCESSQYAPREARTPDLEVNSLTL